MISRSDISNKLIHFTRGANYHEAFSQLQTIINEHRLIGGNGMIRGGYRCVCFTEAPLPSLAGGFNNPAGFYRYLPFGITFEKSWIFARGGRPVIYQPDNEYSLLPEDLRWRYVRYEPTRNPPIDFTWEREWRIRCDDLVFSPEDVTIILPDGNWTSLMIELHTSEQDFLVEMYSTVFSQEMVAGYRETFQWQIATLL